MRGRLKVFLIVATCVLLVTPFAVAAGATRTASLQRSKPFTIQMSWGKFTLSPEIQAAAAKKLKEGKELDIPVFSFVTGDEFFVPVRRGIADAGKKLHVKSGLFGPVGVDQPKMLADIESYLARKPDGIAVQLGSENDARALINRLVDSGIPVITYGTDAPTTKRLAFTGQDLTKSGFEVGKLMVQKLKAKGVTSGSIALFATAATADYAKNHRIPGFVKAVKQALPKIKFLTPVTVGADISAAVGLADAAVRGKSDVVGMYSADEQVVALATWEKQNAQAHKYVIVGHNVLPTELRLMADGYIDGLVGQKPYLQGYNSVAWIYRFVTTGKVICRVCDTGFPIVATAAKAKQMLATNCGGQTCG
jgi:simple sugar transport system substrate-binding protein